MKHVFLAIGLLILAAPCVAAESDVTGFEIVRFGIYERDVTSTERDSDGVLQSVVRNPRLASHTATVPAKIGVSFGVEYKIIGTPDGAPISIRKVVRYPAPGATLPGASKPLASNSLPTTTALNDVRYSGYTLEEPWELLTGNMDDRILVRRSQARRARLHTRSAVDAAITPTATVCGAWRCPPIVRQLHIAGRQSQYLAADALVLGDWRQVWPVLRFAIRPKPGKSLCRRRTANERCPPQSRL